MKHGQRIKGLQIMGYGLLVLLVLCSGCAKKEDKLLSAKVAHEKGVRAYDARKYQEALSFFKQAVEKNPKFSEAWCDYGIALMDLGKFEEAAEPLKKSVHLKSDYAKAHYALAVAYIRNKEPQAKLARSEYEKAVKLGYKVPDWFVKYLAAVEKKR